MTGITYSLVDFVTGGPIIDLPVRKGAEWSSQLGRADALSCSVSLRAAAARGLDLRAASEPGKTVMLARTDEDSVLAWGLIGDDGRAWDEDTKTVTLSAIGIEDTWLAENPIAPAAALVGPLTVLNADGIRVSNPLYDTTISGVSHGTIGKRLVQQLLTWPGSPAAVFDLPADEAGSRTESYAFSAFKSVGSALSDLTKQEDGPDFAFRAYRASNGLTLRYQMIAGTEAQPRIGTAAGVWSLGKLSPITGLKVNDAVAGGVFVGWMSAGKQSANVLMSRALRLDRLADGYPPRSVVDTSRSDVSVQDTLDSYNAANVDDRRLAIRDIDFSVRGDASPSLGNYRPGDTIEIDVPDNHLWLSKGLTVRLTSISGDETGKSIKIGCVILDG